ncbi:hypothetical protein NC997_09095 [Trichocoleus sp. DQ-A2]|uniref:hypothetical protein n=1 Tax=Trichocoleus sp. DQ-A2 TaxID=2933924 RepID=UPI0019A73B53|nr:hypothetical protein [Coleofasciculus sp. FACHB-T130]
MQSSLRGSQKRSPQFDKSQIFVNWKKVILMALIQRRILSQSSQYDKMASNLSSRNPVRVQSASQSQHHNHWSNFEEMLQRLHAEGLYIHPEHLAEFLLAHGIPVNLRYVPEHLKSKAVFINENYQGDMAHLVEEPDATSSQFPWLN